MSDGEEQSILAFNEYIDDEIDTVIRGVIWGEKHPKLDYRGNRIVVSTARGSTAYNNGAGGPIHFRNSDHLAVNSICASAGMHAIRNVITPKKVVIGVTGGKAIGHADTKRNDAVGVWKVITEPITFKISIAFVPEIECEAIRYF